jgi:iron complex outermembrane recepter protein
MLRIESTDRDEIENKRGGMNMSGDVSFNRHRAAVFCLLQGDLYMKKGLCAADALGKIRASMVSALFCAAALSGPAMADLAAGPAGGPAGGAPAAKGGGELEEIVVTAEKRDSTVQATAISITALNTDDLQMQGITNVEDMVGKVPGLSLRTAGPGQTEYEMRGLSAGGGTAATVGFYLDETPLSASAVALNGRTVIDPDLFDLNHVETLRGPQGTLYGSGSMGGTIKLVTNQPKLDTYEAATDTSVSQTSHGSTNGGGSLMLNLPIGDIAAFRMVTTAKYVSGWIDRIVAQPGEFPSPTAPAGSPGTSPFCAYYCDRGNVAAAPVQQVIKGDNLERYVSARGMLLVKPSDSLSVTGTLMYQRIEADGYNAFQQQPGGLTIYQPYDQPEPYYDSFKLASLKAEYNFGPATLTSATSYWSRFVEQSQDATEALQNINNLTHLVNGAYVPNFIQSLYVEDDPTNQFSEELRLTSNGSGRLQWVTGLYYAKLDSGYITYNQDPGFATALTCGYATYPVSGYCPPGTAIPANSTLRYPNPALPPYPSPQAANPNGAVFNDNNPDVLKQSAVFGETTYKFTDALKLTAGLRYFHFQIDNHADQSGLGTASLNQDATILSQSASGNAVLPKLNLAYEPTQDLTVYGTIAKGSRPGGFNLPIPLPTAAVLAINPNAYNCAAGAVTVSSQPSFTPDSVLSYEIGEKAKFDDRRFTVNADVYYIQWSHIQQVLSLTCGYPYNTNAGNAKSYGPELEMSAMIVPGLTLDVNGAYTQAYISDPSQNAIASGITPGTRVLNVPKYTAVASLNYMTAITDRLNGSFSVTSSEVGPVRDQAAYSQVLPSYNLVDARAGVASGPWALYVVGTNLTNKVAELSIDNTVFAWQTYAITRVSTNQPRTIGLDFQYKF